MMGDPREGAAAVAGRICSNVFLAWAFVSVSAGRDSETHADERSRRRAARARIGAYHEQQLRVLLEQAREGFVRLDAGEIDPFELDDLIHHPKRSARELRPRTTANRAVDRDGEKVLASSLTVCSPGRYRPGHERPRGVWAGGCQERRDDARDLARCPEASGHRLFA